MTKGDVEHYESDMVMKIAKQLIPSNLTYEETSEHRRRIAVDQAINIVHMMMNDGIIIGRFVEEAFKRQNRMGPSPQSA